ncbi:MAG: hypothetical protein DWQ04_31050 [Chloroflexi bacterium]|nr:MAG: hypothetical protein DWQ04_31050 [Chloroflexota bacterium]
MNQQDVFKRVNLVDVIKSFSGGLKNALILIGMLAALLVILITAVSLQKSTNGPADAVSASAVETVYTNPELNIIAKYAGPSVAEKARTVFHTNPELKLSESYAGASNLTDARNVLATNPELKAVGTYADVDHDMLATNPEISTFLRYQD